jgi:phage-related baseplate assembly protein
MILQMEKSLTDLNEIAFRRLEEEGLGASSGRIARLILSIVNEIHAEFYQTLKVSHTAHILSEATGVALDMIGQLLNCTRNEGEDDDTYRYRISKQSLSLATANETAIRLACLSVEGVKDVVMRPYTFGTGSFSVYVVTDTPQTPDNILEEVQNVLEEFKGYGIRAQAFSPKILPVELKARILFDKKVVDLDRQMVRKQAEQAVKDYVNSRNVGETLEPKVIKDMIYNSHKDIQEVEIYHFRINNRPCLLVPQEAAWNERFVEASTPEAILVT